MAIRARVGEDDFTKGMRRVKKKWRNGDPKRPATDPCLIDLETSSFGAPSRCWQVASPKAKTVKAVVILKVKGRDLRP